jgi:hypothetical protein
VIPLGSWLGWPSDDKKHSKKHKKHHSSDSSNYDRHGDRGTAPAMTGTITMDAVDMTPQVLMGMTLDTVTRVVNLLCLFTILAALAGATILHGRVIQIEIVKGGRRKRCFTSFMNDMLLPERCQLSHATGIRL